MSISYDLSGKTAIVTGGANGIGRAIATRLAASSVRVCIWDIEHVDIQGISSIEVDLTQPEQIVSAVKRSLTPDSSIDILVNDAGCLGSYLPFEELPASEWNRILSVNLLSVLPGLPAIAPMLETLLRRTHRQYGFPCWKGRLALSFRLFGCERGSNCVHESTSQGACGNWNSCKLCCTRSHRHRSHLAAWPGGGGRNDLAESAEAPRDCRRSS